MLLPSYIFLRPWYNLEVGRSASSSSHTHVVFLCPHERYAFEAVEDDRTARDAKHVPFVTMVSKEGEGMQLNIMLIISSLPFLLASVADVCTSVVVVLVLDD
jgi:hypothetical protein